MEWFLLYRKSGFGPDQFHKTEIYFCTSQLANEFVCGISLVYLHVVETWGNFKKLYMIKATVLVYSCIFAAACIIDDDDDEACKVDYWLHYKQHIQGSHFNGFAIGKYDKIL